ncbi:hypothetical protein, partial [Kitasatospora sp. NPDC093558]|uniref:hypothetical protein n=1 Tax=Kitasatospora sp. NPDC093558 TaxID=3155201 RepID=UPI00341AD18C
MRDLKTAATAFHVLGESEDLPLGIPDAVIEALLRHRQYTERDYRITFTLHQHPYVRELTSRLLRGSTRELLAADTLRASDGSSLPGGVRVSLPAAAVVIVAASARITLFTAVTIGVGSDTTELAEGTT